MNVDLVSDPQHLQFVLPQFTSIMSGFSYNSGSRYAEFIKGDKVAGYGLTALIAGGAAAAAVKTGLFAKLFKLMSALAIAFWKVLALAAAAVASKFRALFRWIKGLFGSPDRELEGGISPASEQRQLGSGSVSDDIPRK